MHSTLHHFKRDNYSYKSQVNNSLIEFDFNIDDEKWQNEYKEIQKQNKDFDKTLTDVDVSSIKDTIEINVLYTLMAEQDESVKNLIGANGENLNGNGLKIMEHLKLLAKR